MFEKLNSLLKFFGVTLYYRPINKLIPQLLWVCNLISMWGIRTHVQMDIPRVELKADPPTHVENFLAKCWFLRFFFFLPFRFPFVKPDRLQCGNLKWSPASVAQSSLNFKLGCRWGPIQNEVGESSFEAQEHIWLHSLSPTSLQLLLVCAAKVVSYFPSGCTTSASLIDMGWVKLTTSYETPPKRNLRVLSTNLLLNGGHRDVVFLPMHVLVSIPLLMILLWRQQCGALVYPMTSLGFWCSVVL